MNKRVAGIVLRNLCLMILVGLFFLFLKDNDKVYNLMLITLFVVVVIKLTIDTTVELLIKRESKKDIIISISNILLFIIWILFIINYATWREMAIIATTWGMVIVWDLVNFLKQNQKNKN